MEDVNKKQGMQRLDVEVPISKKKCYKFSDLLGKAMDNKFKKSIWR